MNKENWQIVRYSSEYKEQVIELQTHLWGPDLSLNEAYFNWKYEQNPYQTTPILYLAVNDGLVGSIAGYNSSQWQAGNPRQIAECLSGCDAITHPDHRRKGLFSRINMQFLEDFNDGPYDFIFTLSAGTITTSASHKFGWYDLEPNEVGIYFPSPVQNHSSELRKFLKNVPGVYLVYCFVRDKFRKNGSTSMEPEYSTQFHFLDAYFSENKQQPESQHIWMTKQPEISEMSEFVAQDDSNTKIRQVRDETFFQWRYKNPRAAYRFLYYGHDPIEGYLVLRESIYPKRTEVQIVDWEIGDLDLMNTLLRLVIAQGRFNALTIWTTTLSDAEKELLLNLNFSLDYEWLNQETGAARPSVMIKPLAEHHEDDWAFKKPFIADVNNWDIRSIYSDGY